MASGKFTCNDSAVRRRSDIDTSDSIAVTHPTTTQSFVIRSKQTLSTQAEESPK